MVLFFQPTNSDYIIYMGRDKRENEDLIAHGLPEDLWFHVDALSSAHVYLRLPEGITMDDIDQETLEECSQLVKANSIQGNKQNNVDIVYTPWANLKKTASMEVGQVGFHNNKEVKKYHVQSRKNEIVNRLNKTRKEEYPDLRALRAAYDAKIRAARKSQVQELKQQEKKEKEAKVAEKKLKSYTGLLDEGHMTSNKTLASMYQSVEDMEDDFM